MNKKLSLWIVSLVVISLMTACSLIPSPVKSEHVRSINVSGTGRVTVVPDIATINIGVRTEAEIVTDALQANTDQAETITKTLQSMGVAKEDIQTSSFYVYQTERYDPMSGQVEGHFFVVENTVHVTVRDLSSLGEVLSAVVEAGANNIYGINFNVEDREAAIAEAQQLAIDNAKAKAALIADAAGVELGELMQINVFESGTPTPYDGYGYGAFTEGDVPISAGSLTIKLECHLTYAIK